MVYLKVRYNTAHIHVNNKHIITLSADELGIEARKANPIDKWFE